MTEEKKSVVPHRTTEGNPMRGEAATHYMTETKRQRGRPKGARNKAKQLIPSDLANSILLQMRDTLPPEHFDYIRGVIKDGKAVSTELEAKTMLMLLGRNLYPAILEENRAQVKPSAPQIDPEVAKEFGIKPEDLAAINETKDTLFRKDVSERLKVWASILNIVHQMEKHSADESDTRQKPIFEIFARRGIDGERLRVLVGVESSALGRDTDEVGRQAIEARTVSSELPERPLDISDSEQGEADWVLDPSIDRDLPLSDNEEELQG